MKLNQKVVDSFALPPNRSEIIAFDDDLPGLGLRLRQAGSRAWVYQYKLGTKQRRLTLGSASTIRLDQARATASKLHAQVRLGFDPVAERTERRIAAAETFGAALRIYLARQKGRVRSRSYVEISRYLDRYFRPLHEWPFSKTDRRAVAEALTKIETEHGPAAANRARTTLTAFYAWCIAEGITDHNPVTGTARRAESGRSRVLSESDLRAVWHALGNDEFSAILRLLILTSQRREEIGGLRWSEVDPEAGLIRLPAERVKNKREHIIPLSAPARAILETQPRRDGRDFVFGRGEGGFSGWSRCKARLDARIAEMIGHPLPGWTIHDIRRSVVTFMAELGVQPHAIEAVINHISGSKAGVAGIYNRSTYEREKATALEMWNEHLSTLIEGRESRIISLRR